MILHTGYMVGKSKYRPAVSGTQGNGRQYIWHCLTFADCLLAGHLGIIPGIANSMHMCLCIVAVHSLPVLQLLAPACADCNSMQGVLPGEYQVVWRTRKSALRPVGLTQEKVHMSVSCESVHSSEDGSHCQDKQTEIVQDLLHFNDLPDEQWVDVPGGNILIADFAKVFVRLWCHSGQSKSGLSWDYVKLVDVNQPLSIQPGAQQAAQPAPAGVSGLAENLRNDLHFLQRDGCQMVEERGEAFDEDQESAESDEGEEEEIPMTAESQPQLQRLPLCLAAYPVQSRFNQSIG